MNHDNIPLLQKNCKSGLSLFFTILCLVDIFGVFPIIALPRSIVQCGWYGFPLVLTVFGFQIYTAALLGKSWNIAIAIEPGIFRKNRYPLAAVTELTLGRWASLFVSILLDLTLFGGGIPNLLVASQNLQLFGLKVSQQEFNLSFCYWLLIIGLFLCPVMWLGSPRDMKLVAIFSTLAVFITALLVWCAILIDNRDMKVLPTPSAPSWEKFISGYGMLAFQFDVHPTLMTIQVDMKKSTDINKAVLISFLISGSLFAITAGLSVWRYGGSTSANLFQVLPSGKIIEAAILVAALQLCLSSAIGHSALFQHFEDRLQLQRTFGWKRCAVRSAIVLLGVAVGESVPRFDIVMSLIGGTLIGPLVFVLPPLIYAKIQVLHIRSVQRISAAEFHSDELKRHKIKANNIFTNSRIHSSSTHYFFCDIKENKNNEYSYIYYKDMDDIGINLDTEQETLLNIYTYSSRKSDAILELSRRENLPIVLNVNQPLTWKLRKQKVNFNTSELKEISIINNLGVWFGYCVLLSGIVITISSTYINVKNTIRFVKFIPPCIINTTYIPSFD